MYQHDDTVASEDELDQILLAYNSEYSYRDLPIAKAAIETLIAAECQRAKLEAVDYIRELEHIFTKDYNQTYSSEDYGIAMASIDEYAEQLEAALSTPPEGKV